MEGGSGQRQRGSGRRGGRGFELQLSQRHKRADHNRSAGDEQFKSNVTLLLMFILDLMLVALQEFTVAISRVEG